MHGHPIPTVARLTGSRDSGSSGLQRIDVAESPRYLGLDMKLMAAVGDRKVLAALATSALLLAWGCGGSSDPSTEPRGCESTCAVGVCQPETGNCVECLSDRDCDRGQTCVDLECEGGEGGAPGVDPVCTPGSTRCSADRATVLTCNPDGSAETSESCAADAPCTVQAGGGARCADWICSPNSFSCDGDTLSLCSDDGTQRSPFHTCDADQYCDARQALCIDRVCTPGEASCDGAVLQVCNEQGSAQQEQQQCSLSEQCTPEGCVALQCVPNATFCKEGKVWQCNGDATASKLVSDCAAAEQFCREQDGAASCSDQVCFPGDPVCNEGVATTCKPDGSGPKPGGDVCTDANQVCFAGVCQDQVCTPGQKLCDHDSVYLCAENGTDTTLYKACQSYEFCDSASGSCKTRICTPGLPGCYGTVKTLCKADGSGYDPSSVDCADSGKACDNGSCVTKVCKASSTTCVDSSTVGYCNSSGSAIYSTYPCYQGSHCSAGSCVANVCVPGTAACDGTKVSTCNADGSGSVPGSASKDCATDGQICDSGACKPKLCQPSAYFCSAGNVQRCSASGGSFTLYQYCTSETYCQQLGTDPPTCAPKLCVKGTTGCLGEDYGTCAADGMSLTPGFSDCDSGGQVCSLQGCASTALDSIGNTTELESLGSGTVVFDRVHVTTPRKLAQISTYLTLPSERTLRWTVYKGAPYEWSLVFDQVTTSSGAQYHSSDAMSVTLEANKDYLIGVSVSGGSFASHLASGAAQQALSFGTTAGSGSSYFSTTLGYFTPSGSLRAMKLTTTLP